MKYILIENMGYDGKNFYSFESDKGKEELKKELEEFFSKDNYSSRFYGHNIYSSCIDSEDFEIVTIEEFWKDYLPA